MQEDVKSTRNNFVNKLHNLRFIFFIGEKRKVVRKGFDKTLNKSAKKLNELGIKANYITIIGFIVGLFSLNFLSYENYFYALICILINRLFDFLDGAIARISEVTKFGIFIDTLFDYIFYAAVIFGFAFTRSEHNALAAAFLLFSLFCFSCSMLSYALIDNKNLLEEEKKKKETPFYLKGIIQGYEVFCAIVLACLFPRFFPIIAVMVGILCLIKAISVIIKAYYNFVILQKK
ncbi:MAG: CDP-alcohol phosphatidyltransferase family protein [Alphaproteobacteria bacterium]|nr:CDP-alcohol phosphatidyltransferase family protein [Alphaproteobacteria bacterium]